VITVSYDETVRIELKVKSASK